MDIAQKTSALQAKIDKEFLQQRLDVYAKENEKLEKSLKLLHVLDDDGVVQNAQIHNTLEKLVNVQEKFGVDRFDPTAMSMVHIDHMHKKKDLSGNLQRCISVQDHISTKISEELKTVKLALTNAKQQISALQVSTEELKILQEQLNKYETEINRYENRYPWLKDPNFDLIAIMDKIDDLKVLQNEELKLNQALEQFQGLKPSVAEAHQQLIQLKEEYNNINANLFNLL